jgi:hypothetical protein
MTTPRQRMMAIFETRCLLEALTMAPDSIAHRMVRQEALRLLEDYPLNAHMELTAVALPDMWELTKI